MSELASVKDIRGGVVQYGNDASIWVEFSFKPIYQGFESEKQGRPVYKDAEFITMEFPGDRTKKIEREVTPEDKLRFPKHYDVFKAQGEQVMAGTPITEWPPITKSQALEFKGMKIHTVEQLAGLPDTALTWLGARDMRAKAQAYLDNAAGGAAVSQLQHENKALKADLDAMKAQLAELSKQKKKGE